MTKKQKIIFKWTAYFILLIILNISLISGILLFIGQDERLNDLKAIFFLEVALCGFWGWIARIKEFEHELKKLQKRKDENER